MRPLIGVTMSWVPGDPAKARPARSQVNDAYLRAVEGSGAIPLPIGPGMSPASLAAMASRLDGLLLTGGADVDPGRYGQPAHPKTEGTTPVRDETEAALVALALDSDLPLLAVCRGMQILNVALGGTLHQHVPDVFGDDVQHSQTDAGSGREEASHAIRILPDAQLGRMAGGERVLVNSMHHQAVDRLGVGLRPVAWADDGLVEALELPGRPVLAVQWHPEELLATSASAGDALSAALFAWLAEAAAVAVH